MLLDKKPMNDLVVVFNDCDFEGFKTILNSQDCSNMEDIITNAKKQLIDSLKLLNLSLLVSKAEKKKFYIIGAFEDVVRGPIRIYEVCDYENRFVPSYNYGYDYWNMVSNYGFGDAIIGQNP